MIVLFIQSIQAESAWRHYRSGLGATARQTANYESQYWKFVQNRFVGVWRIGVVTIGMGFSVCLHFSSNDSIIIHVSLD